MSRNIEKEKINFKAIGRNILIELGRTETRNGIVLPQQTKNSDLLEQDEAFKIKAISDEGMETTGLEVGQYIYLTAYAKPGIKFEKYGKRFALIEVSDIAGFAPDGFDRKSWSKEKEEDKKKLGKLIKGNATLRKA